MALQPRIDWKRQRQYRDSAARLEHDSLVYLLKPEVSDLIDSIDEIEKKIVFLILWCTGSKTTEVIQLTAADIRIRENSVDIHIPVAGKGRSRVVPIYEKRYIETIIAWKKSRRFASAEKLWPVTRQTVTRWFNGIVQVHFTGRRSKYAESITIATLRHSFAMNWLIHSAPVHLLVDIMGYKHPDRVAHYIRYLEYDDKSFFKSVRFK